MHALLLAASIVLPPPPGSAPGTSSETEDLMHAYIGTYTREGGSKGIYRLTFDLDGGMLGTPALVAEASSPSFLALHPDGRSLFAVAESGGNEGGLQGFSLRPDSGELTATSQASSGGGGPCHLIVAPSGKHVLAANYGGGSAIAVALDADAKLGRATAFVQHAGNSANPNRQEGPHAHSINLDPSGKFALVADLGLDQILIYRFNPETGTLTPNDPPFGKVAKGAGPRHLAFHPDGRSAFVCNEMALTVTAFAFDPERGTLTERQTIPTLPDDAKRDGASTAEIQVHKSGKFLYCSNRGHDSIAVFSIGPEGRLSRLENEPTGGKTPRNFGIDPTGNFLVAANQDSDSLVSFRIHQETGMLEPTGAKATVPMPVCVKFLPTPATKKGD